MTEEKKQEALALIKGRVEEAHKNKYKDVKSLYRHPPRPLQLNLQQTN
jgi:hypothetical protein